MVPQQLAPLQDRRGLTLPRLLVSSAVIVLHDQVVPELDLLAECAGRGFCALADP